MNFQAAKKILEDGGTTNQALAVAGLEKRQVVHATYEHFDPQAGSVWFRGDVHACSAWLLAGGDTEADKPTTEENVMKSHEIIEVTTYGPAIAPEKCQGKGQHATVTRLSSSIVRVCLSGPTGKTTWIDLEPVAASQLSGALAHGAKILGPSIPDAEDDTADRLARAQAAARKAERDDHKPEKGRLYAMTREDAYELAEGMMKERSDAE